MAKVQIRIKGKDIQVMAHEGFVGGQCVGIQDLLSGQFVAKGVTTVKQEMTVNADAADRQEFVPEHVQNQ